MSKKSQEKEMDDYPVIQEITPIGEESEEDKLINLIQAREEKRAMPKEKKSRCPICHEEKSMQVLCRGKNQRLWACRSKKCSKGPLQMGLLFQLGNNVPVVFELKAGQMFHLEESLSNDDASEITEESA